MDFEIDDNYQAINEAYHQLEFEFDAETAPPEVASRVLEIKDMLYDVLSLYEDNEVDSSD